MWINQWLNKIQSVDIAWNPFYMINFSEGFKALPGQTFGNQYSFSTDIDDSTSSDSGCVCVCVDS